MRILVDENVPNPTVRFLRARGDDALDVRGTDLREWMTKACSV